MEVLYECSWAEIRETLVTKGNQAAIVWISMEGIKDTPSKLLITKAVISNCSGFECMPVF